MSSQGPNSPGTATDLADTGQAWSNVNNVLANDGAFATCVLPSTQVSNTLELSNFGFSIPAGSTINGIIVEVDKKQAGGGGNARWWSALWYVGATFKGVPDFNTGVLWPTTAAYASEGTSTTGAGTLSASDINSSSFKLRVQVYGGSGGATVSIDHFRVTVYYTLGPAITETGSLSDFGSVAAGSVSSNQTFTVAGTNLTADIVVTAPSSDFQVSLSSGSGFGSSVTVTQSGGTVTTTTIYTRFSPQSSGVKSGNYVVSTTGATSSNVAASGTGTSTIIETGSLSDFGSIAVGANSSNQTFTVAGTGLTANLVVTAPSSDFQVSLSSGSGFGSSVSIAPSSNTVTTTTIYTRFTPQSAGAKSGNVACTSTGATTQNVAVSGTGTGLSNFSYKKAITIDHTKVANTDQSNFPVLISMTDASLKTVGNGGHVQSSSGYDIAFYSDSGLTTALKFERELHVASTGQVVFWVKIPTLSHTTDTVIYMGYGDSGTTTDQSDKTNVWDSNFKAVYHLGDGSTLSVADSTVNANTLTNNNTTPAVAGQVNGGANFNGSNQNLTLSGVLGLGTTNITASMWVNALTASESGAFIKIGDASSGYGLGVGSTDFDTNGNKLLALFEVVRWITVGPNIGTGWHHVALKIDGSGIPSVTLDGGTPTTSSGSGAVTPANTISIGGYTSSSPSNRFGNYYLDEIRISNTARSTDWTTTEYNNQSSPSTFYTVGSESTTGGTTNFFLMF